MFDAAACFIPFPFSFFNHWWLRTHGTTRITSSEKRKIQLLITAGVLDTWNFLDSNEETGILPGNDDAGSDNDVEIEMVEEEPDFLRGKMKVSLPGTARKNCQIKIVVNPEKFF